MWFLHLPWDFCYDPVAGGILLISGQTVEHERCDLQIGGQVDIIVKGTSVAPSRNGAHI